MAARKRRLRKVAVLPAVLTLCNGVCGFASIIVASRIHRDALFQDNPGHADAMTYLLVAGLLIFGGMIFDALDGRMARIANSASKFGAELDSLCDVISFGAAPAFLLLKLGPTPDDTFLYNILFVSAVSYVICTILRLARFNVESSLDEESHRVFKGLPSPAAAGCIAAIAIMRHHLQNYDHLIGMDRVANAVSMFVPFGALGLAMLMVSNIAYPHLVNQSLRGRRPFSHLVELVVLAITLVVVRELSLVLAFWGFALMGPMRRGWRYFRKTNDLFVDAGQRSPEAAREDQAPSPDAG